MLKGLAAGTAQILLTTVMVSAAAQPVRFEISPQVGQSFGETTYEIKLAGYLDNNVDIVTLRSKLKFPVENKLIGGTAGIYAGYGPSPKWSLEASILSSAGDPGGVVTDQDWIGQLNQFEIEWSNTESDAEGSFLQLDLEGTLLLLDRSRFSFALLGGFSYEKIDQTIIGATGWQLQPGSTLFDFGSAVNLELQGAVGEYRITYKMPQVGVASRLFLSPRTSLLLRASAIAAFFDDHDDHLLRGKVADADGDGFGFNAALNFRYDIGSGSRAQPFFAVEGRTLIVSADGKQRQTWYADDPATPDVDDTGTTYGQIPYSIELKQYSIMVRFGLRF